MRCSADADDFTFIDPTVRTAAALVSQTPMAQYP